jgi:hypothetical protein
MNGTFLIRFNYLAFARPACARNAGDALRLRAAIGLAKLMAAAVRKARRVEVLPGYRLRETLSHGSGRIVGRQSNNRAPAPQPRSSNLQNLL